MKKSILTGVLVALFATLGAQNYTLQDIVSGKFSARGVSPVESSADGMYYYQMNREHSALQKFDYANAKLVATLVDVAKVSDSPISSFDSFVVSPDGSKILLATESTIIYRRSSKSTYYVYDTRTNTVQKLSQNSEQQMIPTFSPDSKKVAYVISNNIWIKDFVTGVETQVTGDGAFNKIINGTTDWVYEEEFEATRLMEFSPDSKVLAFVRSDESNVPLCQFQTYEQKLYPAFYEYKYPKPGENNSVVECRVYDVATKATRKLPVPLDSDGYIPRIKFTQNAHELAVMTFNRNQNQFKMYFADTMSDGIKLVLQEENQYYVDSNFLTSIHFLKNKFTYISERDGYSHIYLFDYAGRVLKQVTKGKYDVIDLLAVDESSNALFYVAADESPLRRNIYSVNMNTLKAKKLSEKSGYNSASFSENGKYFVNRWSNAITPSVTALYNAKGKLIRVLEENKNTAKSILEANIPTREFITVPAADGTTQLNAWIVKPHDFDPTRKYPLVMVQYSGPNSQQVSDSYNVDWSYALLKEGFLVACVDGRGTAARGEAFRKCTYMNLGIIESDDQVSAARYFGTLPYVDKDRIGIWGWSYGGYNVLMSMSRGDGVFKAGVAIAAVSDWRFYDTVYTERFMRTPQQNPEGYDNGSAVKLADKLQGKLLLMHGTADDNVLFQHAMDYTQALVKADKHFEMFVYPDKNHFIYGGNTRLYLYQKVVDFYKKNL